jgi:hypothetical protein
MPNSMRHAKSLRHVNLRLERWHRLCIYAICAWLLVTGLLWLAAHYFLQPSGEFGAGVHPLEPWAMKLHGAGAMFILFFLGSLMNSHIRRALKSGRNLSSGWFMIAACTALIVTGYALYYLASEETHRVWSAVHWIVGLAFPLLIVLHITLGRRSSR